MSDLLIVGCALEYWRASGPRTFGRLADLCTHFAGQYRRDRGEIFRLALELVADREVASLDVAAERRRMAVAS